MSTNGASVGAGNDGSASGLLADLALLQGAGDHEGYEDEGVPVPMETAQHVDRAGQWKPPEDQKGDGRTKLNDLLGY